MSSNETDTPTRQRRDGDAKLPANYHSSAMVQRLRLEKIQGTQPQVTQNIVPRRVEGRIARDITIHQDEEEHMPMDQTKRTPLRVMIVTYRPITSLNKNWNVFFSAFFALFHCHAILWSVDIRHPHITQTNLQWDPVAEMPRLCDFDFCKQSTLGAEERGPGGSSEFSRGGTWIFAAAELLDDDAMNGEVKQVYRHEVEAFIAVLVWIVCRYHDGKSRDGHALGHWIQRTYWKCKEKRGRTFDEISKGAFPQPPGVPADEWEMIEMTLDALALHHHQLRVAQLSQPGRRVPRFAGARSPSPSPYPSQAQPRRLSEFNDLCALCDILNWPIFLHSECTKFYTLIKHRILKHASTRATG